MGYEVLLRDKDLIPIAILYPLASGIQPTSLKWKRHWRQMGQVELTIPRQTPHLTELMTLGNYIEIKLDGASEAIYIIDWVELKTGIFTYTKDMTEHINAVYMAGQGAGVIRDVVLAKDDSAIDEVGRFEAFEDARDVELGFTALLSLRGDSFLREAAISEALIMKAGEPVKDEILTVRGSGLLLHAHRRIVLPPPAEPVEPFSELINILDDLFDSVSILAADRAMKHYLDAHIIGPQDANRKVDRFVNGVALAQPLRPVSFDARFQTVLEVLQELARASNSGFEVTLNSDLQFEFQVIRLRDRTDTASIPVVFRDGDVLLDIDGREYRNQWDLGDLVTLELEPLSFRINVPIWEVEVTVKAGQPDRVSVACDVPSSDDIERFVMALNRKISRGKSAARI